MLAEPFIGEIRPFAFGFAPVDWLPCDGRTLRIDDYQNLYAVIGNIYGGDSATFKLPDLRGRTPINFSNSIPQGLAAGSESYSLHIAEMPQHTHLAQASSQTAADKTAAESVWAVNTDHKAYANTGNKVNTIQCLANAGASEGHGNMQPYTVISYCIATQGIFPARS